MKRERESVSSIGQYTKCPAAYAFKYRDHLPDPSGPEAVFGTAFHEAVYASWHSRATEHPDERISRMLAALYADKQVDALPHVELFHGVTCEREIVAEVRGQKMVGFIDIDLTPFGVPFLIDIKTSSKRIDARKLGQTRQHIHYPLVTGTPSLLYLLVISPKMQIDGCPVPLEEQLADWVPSVQWKLVTPTGEEKTRWEDEVEDTTLKIRLDHFPTVVQPLCSWCPYQGVCPAWND